MGQRDKYEVICGNIGYVYEGDDKAEAEKTYNTYVEQSKDLPGCRAYGEDVCIMENDPNGNSDIIAEHHGHLQNNDV